MLIAAEYTVPAASSDGLLQQLAILHTYHQARLSGAVVLLKLDVHQAIQDCSDTKYRRLKLGCCICSMLYLLTQLGESEMKKALIIAGIAACCLSAPVFADEAAAKKAGCMNCHAVDKKVVGPSFKDIAAKYKGDAGAADKLIAKVNAGGSGAWGPMPMPAQKGKLTDAELKDTVTWILSR